MATNILTLFCAISGELASNAFKVKPFQAVPLEPRRHHTHHCRVTIGRHGVDPKIAVLRKQLSDMLDGSIARQNDTSVRSFIHYQQAYCHFFCDMIDLGIIIKPEKKATFTWSTIVNGATLDNLKCYLFEYYPQYDHDKYLEIIVYSEHPRSKRIRSDDDLRKVLKVAKTTSKTKLTISLETSAKDFSSWTFKDVCTEYNLSPASDPGLDAIPPFIDIKAASLDSDLEKRMLDQLINAVESMVDVLNLPGANEATKSMIISASLVKVMRLFNEVFFLVAQRGLSGY